MKRNNELNNESNKEILKKIIKIIKIVLFILMLILIYIISPRITYFIQNAAMYIVELDSNLITRIVELILSTICVSFVITKIIKEK